MNILSLEQVPHFSTQVIQWLKYEWGEMEILKTIIDIGTKKTEESLLPKIFVGFENDTLIGTVSLLDNDMCIRPEFNPWLGCLYVNRAFRHKGMANHLFNFCENYACKIDISTLYLFTAKIQKIALNRNWKSIEEVFFEGEIVTIMSKEIN